MTKIDFTASDVHFVDHLQPVWAALKPSIRGVFHSSTPQAHERALSYGIESVQGVPGSNLTLACSFTDYKRAQGPVILMEHGAGFSFSSNHPSYAGGRGKDRVVLFLTPNEISANRNKAAYPDIPIKVIGMPKLDTVVERPATGRTVAISFHWDARQGPETRTSLPYYRPILRSLAKHPDFTIIGHCHPRKGWPDRVKNIYRYAGIPYYPRFERVLEEADLYITDSSSTGYEFAAAGRHAIYLNAPWYRRDVNHGIRYWDHLPGPMVDKPTQLIPTILDVLDNPHKWEQQRVDAVNTVLPYKGRSAARAANIITRFVNKF